MIGTTNALPVLYWNVMHNGNGKKDFKKNKLWKKNIICASFPNLLKAKQGNGAQTASFNITIVIVQEIILKKNHMTCMQYQNKSCN